MTRKLVFWRDWPLFFVGLCALGALLLCVASGLAVTGTAIGWLLPVINYSSPFIIGPLALGVVLTASPFFFWRALVAGQRRHWGKVAAFVALAGVLLLVALGSYNTFFHADIVVDSVSTSTAHYKLFSAYPSPYHTYFGLDAVTLFACDQSDTFCHVLYQSPEDDSLSADPCSAGSGGCFLKNVGGQVQVYIGGKLVYTTGP
jgi:hypothetical protein